MNIYCFRRLLFNIYSYFISALRIITFNSKKGFNYHQSFFRLIRNFKKSFYFNLFNYKIFYDPVFSGMGWKYFFEGSTIDKELEICKNFIKTDSIILDVGANIGINSVFYATLAPKGRVFAFEPSRFTYELLTKNVRNSSTIIPLNFGLFNKTGIMEFFECENDALSGLKDTLRSHVKAKTNILCLRGDDWLELVSPSKIDFIKIDVEGLEKEVVEGLEKTIKKYLPVLFIEIYQGKNSNPEPEKTVEFIRQLGYVAYTLSADGTLKEFRKHTDNEYSYFFIAK